MSPPRLVAQDLGVVLGGRRVVKDVAFALEAGRLVALVGPNGAGKTSLLRALCGLVPCEGSVEIEGRPLAALGLRERARTFAYLPQGHAAHWPLPVRDIVALGRYPHGAADPARLRPEHAAAVDRAMDATGVAGFAQRRVTDLSGGERARVALARVLAVEAPVVLADEPTASLDPRFQLDVMEVLRRTAKGGALVLVVTHDLSLAARFSDVVLVMDQGRLAACGAPGAALDADILAGVFRIEAYRGERAGDPVLVPWARAGR